MSFFESLQTLPPNPDVQSLRQVFQWYDSGFLQGVDYEADPAAAWRLYASPPGALRRSYCACIRQSAYYLEY